MHRHTQSPSYAGARWVADDEYMGGGLGDKMEDWVEQLHQDGKQKWLRFRTVQNPIARAHAREKAHLRNMHPDVISQTNKINEGNKRNLAELKTDLVGTLQKKQRNFGWYKAMKYFMQDDVKRLSWSAPIFNDGKVDSKDGAIVDGGIFVSSSKCLWCEDVWCM